MYHINLPLTESDGLWSCWLAELSTVLSAPMVLKGQSSQQSGTDLQRSYFLQLLHADLGMEHAIISIATFKPAKT